ncbi:nickel pincer cofactor biosynthesis protein LarB [Stackebrandtia soli]|uniref:nickel pincer cofactor biosynthesis protein LarB n=1 Tax=Stackebrandtia soli TaxID=1892856 RepID=UPI0039E88F59
MDREQVTELLTNVASGRATVDTALAALTGTVLSGGNGYIDLGHSKIDTHRALRTGEPEAVYAAGKTTGQLIDITTSLLAAHPDRPVLLTRISDEATAALRDNFDHVTADPLAAAATVGPPASPRNGEVAIACAGTSDLPVAAEAAFTTRAFGLTATMVTDVGVAGIHRVLASRPTLADADCVIVVAGMDGALPSVIGGLIDTPLIAVPTSVGYGSALGGMAPLLTMLNSCAPGVAVVNIDNGYGAAVCAARVVRARHRRVTPVAQATAGAISPPPR